MKGFEADDVLREALKQIVEAIPLEPSACIALSGSLARSSGDRYSDIDLWVIAPDEARLATLRAAVIVALEHLGEPVTTFVATHLGIENLVIFFTEFRGRIVKIDVEFVALARVARPAELVALRDPAALFDRMQIREPVVFDIDDANRRVAGWLWYAYAKIARGELLEARDALDGLRKLAFVPLQLHLAGAAIEGYRRVEQKLDRKARETLEATFPADNSAGALISALFTTARAFRDLYLQAGGSVDGVNRVDRMIAAVERDIASA